MLQGTQDLARCFDLRADLKNDDLLCCDYDNDDNLLEQTQRSHRMWECHGQEALMKVDFSDNDFSVLDVVHCSLDSRIECYRSVQTLRVDKSSTDKVRKHPNAAQSMDFKLHRLPTPLPPAGFNHMQIK